jgi:multidrug efflux system membrane fusion protein
VLNLKEQTPPSLRDRQPLAFVRKRRGLVILGVVVVVLLGLIARTLVLHRSQNQDRPDFQRGNGGGRPYGNGFQGDAGFNGPVAVTIATAAAGDIPIRLPALGTITPLVTVTVKTQISGQLVQIAFTEGQLVHKGDFLAQVDQRPYKAALEQAEGNLKRDQALLANARLDLKRYEDLLKEDGIPAQQVDTQKATVAQEQGIVQTDEASVEAAKVNLAFTHIVSPATGRAGLRQVDQGNYVTPADANGIVVIAQLQPITAIFPLPEDNVSQISKRLTAGATLPVTAFDRSNKTQLATGKLLTLDNQIDTTTGTIKLKALFDNTDGALFPNQFVNVQLVVDTLHGQVLIPAAAVHRGAPNGVISSFVYLVDTKANRVSVRPVVEGITDGDTIAIAKGLSPGDVVVTEGGDRLRDGAQVLLPGKAPPQPPAGGGWRRGKGRSGNFRMGPGGGGGR